MESKYNYLGRVNSPEDIKKLNSDEIKSLCSEIRECIVETTEENGGHLASNLGAVELSVAIHRVFDCPQDHVIFDVGHQSYTHKLLTGRYDRFSSLRKPGGITGFTNREESEYDCFGAGHSSTSLSAALGFAKADKLSGSDAYTVVVLGDGAFTGGMIHEALNNCENGLKLIIILNENKMSISRNTGGFAKNISNIRHKRSYFKAKRFTVSFIKKIPLVGEGLFKVIRWCKKSVKNLIYSSNYFEDLGLYYLGPADGNEYEDVEALLEVAKTAGESVLVHLKTKKGKGYAPAEENPDKYHGMRAKASKEPDTTFSDEFGKAICSLAKDDNKICAITAAMSSGTGLDRFEKEFPERFFDVGIAEEHAVTFAAGLSANGYKPVFAVYSSFLQRSYDQLIHDAALQKLPMVIAVDRAGFNNSDGVTHHGIFDVAFASQMPGVKIYAPVTYGGLRDSLAKAIDDDSVSIIRYVGGSESKIIKNAFYKTEKDENIGVRCDFSEGDKPKTLIVTHGRIAEECIKAKELISSDKEVGVVLCEYIAPYDQLAEEIGEIICKTTPENLLFVEEEIKAGGFGMLLSEELRRRGSLEGIKYDIMAAENAFVKRKEGESYLSASGLGSAAVKERINQLLEKN